MAVLPIAVAVSVLGLALVVLLSPWYMHAALDLAGAARNLGLTTAQAWAASDRTVSELLFGPGTFAFNGPDGRPFYDAGEAAHMADVRIVLYAFLGVVTIFGAILVGTLVRGRRDPIVWRGVARGGLWLAIGLIVAGIVAALAFDRLFEMFHALLFPGGNFTFDPASQRLVQLYPLAFWQLTAAAMGVIGVAVGLGLWFLGRGRARAFEASGQASAAQGLE